MFDCSSFVNHGPVVQKPINLIQDYRKIWFHSGQLFVESFFCLILFLKLTFANVKCCRISALNNTWELRNKLLGLGLNGF